MNRAGCCVSLSAGAKEKPDHILWNCHALFVHFSSLFSPYSILCCMQASMSVSMLGRARTHVFSFTFSVSMSVCMLILRSVYCNFFARMCIFTFFIRSPFHIFFLLVVFILVPFVVLYLELSYSF